LGILKNTIERIAAIANPRFRLFVEGKRNYLEFGREMGVEFIDMSDENYLRARKDRRIELAERQFNSALELAERANALNDVATAKFQLGLIGHLRGEFDQATELITSSAQIMENLPKHLLPETVSACYYHLGILAIKNGSIADGIKHLNRAREIDQANNDLSGIRECDTALARYA
jgi:tetratricopeptide (TPR) repeat protein